MFTVKRLIGSSLFVFVLFSTALAQENRAPAETAREPVAAGPLVTVTATAKRVRFVSPGTAVQLRLEVYNETGRKVRDTELQGGNVLDWNLQDGAGQPVPAGSYACVLTIKSLSGRSSQRVGLVNVNDQKTTIEPAGVPQLSLAQQQTIGPVEGNAALTILRPSEAEAITAVTHDGTDGQLTSTKGALTFRTGDLFSGEDKEQLRLTEEGNLGIGTSQPKAKLDVTGTIRAERFVVVKPRLANGEQTSADTQATGPGDSIQPLTSGTGTQNRVAKWIDNTGTLGDSVITETAGGNVGIGTASATAPLTVQTDPSAIAMKVFGRSDHYGFLQFYKNDGTTLEGSVFAETGRIGLADSAGVQVLNVVGGNVGIGTTTPGTRLHVAGGDLLFENKWRTETTASTPNLIGGFLGTGNGGATPGNRAMAGVAGATIAGGGFNALLTFPSGASFIGDFSNRVTDWFGTVGGGFANRTGNDDATLDNASYATVGGGAGNTASANAATVSGGIYNNASGGYATVPGGYNNSALGLSSFAAGTQAVANHDGAFVWADSCCGAFTSTANNQFLIRAGGGVGIGTTTTTDAGLVIRTPVGAYSLAVTDGSVKLKARITFGVPSTAEFGTTSNHDLVFVTGGFPAVTIDGGGGGMFPAIDNNKFLGMSSKRWVAVYAVNGTIQTSDARLKKGVTNLGYGLSQVLQLRPITFQWKGRNDGRTYLGLIAQEVEKIIPEAVERDKDPANPLGLNYTSLVPVLIKAVQEQQTAITEKAAAVTALQTENAALKEQNAALEARVAAIELALQQLLGQPGQSQPTRRQQ